MIDDLERQFYEKACISERWSVRDFKRQKDSGLFLRLAASKDKEGSKAFARYRDIDDDMIKEMTNLLD